MFVWNPNLPQVHTAVATLLSYQVSTFVFCRFPKCGGIASQIIPRQGRGERLSWLISWTQFSTRGRVQKQDTRHKKPRKECVVFFLQRVDEVVVRPRPLSRGIVVLSIWQTKDVVDTPVLGTVALKNDKHHIICIPLILVRCAHYAFTPRRACFIIIFLIKVQTSTRGNKR